jgi:dTDP-glucose 4,6-dehydratase
MKLKQELGWKPSLKFEEGIKKTIEWYIKNQDWTVNAVNKKNN